MELIHQNYFDTQAARSFTTVQDDSEVWDEPVSSIAILSENEDKSVFFVILSGTEYKSDYFVILSGAEGYYSQKELTCINRERTMYTYSPTGIIR